MVVLVWASRACEGGTHSVWGLYDGGLVSWFDVLIGCGLPTVGVARCLLVRAKNSNSQLLPVVSPTMGRPWRGGPTMTFPESLGVYPGVYLALRI